MMHLRHLLQLHPPRQCLLPLRKLIPLELHPLLLPLHQHRPHQCLLLLIHSVLPRLLPLQRPQRTLIHSVLHPLLPQPQPQPQQHLLRHPCPLIRLVKLEL